MSVQFRGDPLSKDAEAFRSIAFGTPVAIGTANAEGIDNRFARADHVHAGSGALAAPNLAAQLAPDAWYVMDGNVTALVDQSGNSRSLTLTSAPHSYPGVVSGVQAAQTGKLTRIDAAFRTSAALSIVAFMDPNNAATSWVCSCELNGANGRTWWKFGTLSQQLYYSYDYSTASHQDLASGAYTAPYGMNVLGMTRDAAGTAIAFYANGASVASAAASSASAGGTAARVNIMTDDYNAGTAGIQAIGLWLRELSAADMLTISKGLLGV